MGLAAAGRWMVPAPARRSGRADVKAGRAVNPRQALLGDTGGNELRSPKRLRAAAAENADVKGWALESGDQGGDDELFVVDQDDDRCFIVGVERVKRLIGPV